MREWLVLATDAPVRKDAVIAAVGGSGVFAALMLAILGVVLSGYQDSTRSDDLHGAYRRALRGVLAGLALCLMCAALGFAWLTTGGGGGVLYAAVVSTFFAQLAAIFFAAYVGADIVLGHIPLKR
jgi:cytochrome bd-type quinol oxidase subunit 2